MGHRLLRVTILSPFTGTYWPLSRWSEALISTVQPSLEARLDVVDGEP